MPEREVHVHAFEQRWREGDRAALRDRVLVGHLRALARRRPRRRLLRGAAAHARSARSTSRTPIPGRVVALADALGASCPSRARSTRTTRRARRRVGRGDRRRAPGTAPGAVLLVDDDGPIAIAEPRDGALKPIVGFRRMKVTPPRPDAEPRPRRVAVGTFDGVHLGHREVIAAPTPSLTFDPHPQSVVAPGHAPRLLTTLERKAELVGGLGVEELVVDRRSTARSPRARPQDFVDDVLVGRARRDARVGGGELPLRPQRAGRRGAARRRRRASRRASCRCSRSTARSSPRATSAAWSPAGRRRVRAGALLGAPFAMDGEVVHGDKRGRDARLPDGEPRPRRRLRHARPRRLRVPRANGDGPGTAPPSTSACARVRDRPRRAHRGLPARLRAATSTASSCASTFLKRLRGEKRFEQRRGRSSSRWPRRRGHARDRGRARSAPTGGPAQAATVLRRT